MGLHQHFARIQYFGVLLIDRQLTVRIESALFGIVHKSVRGGKKSLSFPTIGTKSPEELLLTFYCEARISREGNIQNVLDEFEMRTVFQHRGRGRMCATFFFFPSQRNRVKSNGQVPAMEEIKTACPPKHL